MTKSDPIVPNGPPAYKSNVPNPCEGDQINRIPPARDVDPMPGEAAYPAAVGKVSNRQQGLLNTDDSGKHVLPKAGIDIRRRVHPRKGKIKSVK